MVSLNYTSSNIMVRAALRTLDADVKTTQNRIATGLKVASYSDNPSVWSTAQGLRRDIAASDSVKGTITIAKGRADVAATSLTTITDLISQVKDRAAAGQVSGANTTSIAGEVAALFQQINAAIASANFQGENWLADASNSSKTVAVDNVAGVATNMTFATKKLIDSPSGTDTKMKDLVSDTAVSSTMDFAALASAADAAQEQVSTYLGQIKGISSALGQQADFLTKINEIRNQAVGSLVDADLEEESARAKALEVKQQLAYQALSIGNSSQENILLLFR